MATSAAEPDTRPLYQTRHDPTSGEPLSTTLYEALATVEGVAPPNLEIQLYDSIEVDAVDALFRAGTPTDEWHLTVTVINYTVQIHADGRILIQETETERETQ